MKLKFSLLAAAAVSMLSTTAFAVDFGGYTRIGPGTKQQGSDNKHCFNGGADGGHGGIGRLGNECDTYVLSQGGEAGGVNYKTLLMTNFYNPGSEAGGIVTKIQQLYVEGKGFDVAPNVNFWVGRRFGDRSDVHFDDTFYVNMTGTGAGANQIDLGFATLGVAYFRAGDSNPSNDGLQNAPASTTNPNPGNRFNIDLQNINTNPGGKLRVLTTITKFQGTNGKSGFGLGLQHNQAKILLGGDNTLWAQWAQGSAYLDGGVGGATDDSSKKRWRIADSLAWVNGPLTGQTLVQFGEEKSAGGAKRTYNSIGGRAAYAMTKNFKLQAELGMANSKPSSGAASQRVTKFTIAPTLTVGQNYYDRPELRFYFSAYNFNDAYKAAQGQSKTSRTSAGFQAEIWF
jgi:maltoporin